MTNNAELLPCPICARSIHVKVRDCSRDRQGVSTLQWSVSCDGCCLDLFAPSEQEAVKRWNTRLLLQPQAVPDVQKLLDAALEVTAWDWSDNDADCVADMDRLRKIAESMYLSAAPQAVPDGYRLVPVEPTDEMLDAVIVGLLNNDRRAIDHRILTKWYRTMLSAAPQPAPDEGKEIGDFSFDDPEVMYALQMALEHDQPHQAKALKTWMPRITKWFHAAELYHDLLYAVGKKFPDESRHVTALRYIRQAESGHDSGQAATPPASVSEDKPERSSANPYDLSQSTHNCAGKRIKP